MSLHQFHTAQSFHGTTGHATRSGLTNQQPVKSEKFHFDFKEGSGFPTPPKFEDKLLERAYLKGRLAAAFRIFAQWGFEEGVAVRLTDDPIPNSILVAPR